MGFIKRKRIIQVIKYGWKDAGIISSYKDVKESRAFIFIDILSCFMKYYVFSRQYISSALWTLPKEEKESVSIKLGNENKKRDQWIEDYYKNWFFLRKWTDLKWETSLSRKQKRNNAYTKKYNAGKGLMIQFDVHIQREHYLDGTIKIGNHVFLRSTFY